MSKPTYTVLPNSSTDADEWTDREITFVLDDEAGVITTGGDILVEDIRTGEEAWVSVRRITFASVQS